ncbi:MAG: hypothetical protein ABIQ93_13085 [Saprospiraceae bacterium]
MFRIFRCCSFLLFAGFAQAQTTPSDTLLKPKHHFQIGLNMAKVLGGLIGKNDFTEDPYLLSLRFGGERSRSRFGLNFRVKNKTENTFNGKLTTKETAFNFRGGYEWSFSVARRWDLYWGLDGVVENMRTEIKSAGFGGLSTLKTRQWGYGLGPVIGFAWRLHPRVSLSTECSIYALAHSGREEVIAFPDHTKDPTKDFSWQPVLPTSLFVNFSF